MTDRIRESFARQTMMATLGARIVGIEDGAVTIEAPILAGSRQQHGYGHAGLTFSLGDTAAGYAALTLLPPESDVLTVEMKINLLRPCAGDLVTARGRVLKPGRKVLVVTAEVFAVTDATERQIAMLQGTMIPA